MGVDGSKHPRKAPTELENFEGYTIPGKFIKISNLLKLSVTVHYLETLTY